MFSGGKSLGGIMKYNEIWVDGCHCSSRRGWEIQGIVYHQTADDNLQRCIDWFRDPDSGASATYIIDKDGTRYQCVKEGLKHWANGIIQKPTSLMVKDMGVNPNLYTLSVEFLHNGKGEITEDQLQSAIELTKYWIDKYPKIKPDRYHLIGHYEIDSVDKPFCPGVNFPWDRLIAGVIGGEEVDNKDYNLTADQIIGKVSTSPEAWKKCLDSLEKIGSVEGVDLGDLNPVEHIRLLIEKVWKYK